MIREQIIQSEMRVAAQIGLPTTGTSRLLGNTTLLGNSALFSGTQSSKLGLNNTSTLRLHPNTFNRTDNFNGMSVLGSLGFTSPPIQDRLNNTLSPDHSFRADNYQSHQPMAD